jgi:hypothetical protein
MGSKHQLGTAAVDRWEKFAQAILDGKTGTEAVIAAGYNRKTETETQRKSIRSFAAQLRRRPEVRKILERKNTEADQHYAMRKGHRKDLLIERAEKIYNRCMQAEPVRGPNNRAKAKCGGCGAAVHEEWKFDSKGACKALEMLMIEEGMLIRKSEHIRLDLVEGTEGQIVARIVGLIMRMGERVARVIYQELEARLGPRTITIIPGGDQPAREAGEADRKLLSAAPEAG